MSVRSEIENKLVIFAAEQQPPIPIAFEGVDFTKPIDGKYLELFMLANVSINKNVSASGKRTTGMFQINCYTPVGFGMAEVEALRDAVIELYPVVPKIGIVSIEAPLNSAMGFEVDTSICIPVTGKYRVET